MKGLITSGLTLSVLPKEPEPQPVGHETLDQYEEYEWEDFIGLELYLNLFELIPDDIMLKLATRQFDMAKGNLCVCGWAVREGISYMANIEAEKVSLLKLGTNIPPQIRRAVALLDAEEGFCTMDPDWLRMQDHVPALCVVLFGGTVNAWNRLFVGVTLSDQMPLIERAMLLRMNQIEL